MKFSFYFSIIFLIAYLTLNIVMMGEAGGQHPVVQLVAGLAVASMLLYILVYLKRVKKIFYQWSFLLYWGLFVLLVAGYYLLSLVGLPTDLAEPQLRNVVVAIFIYSTILFTYISTIKGHFSGTLLTVLVGALFINGLFEIYNAFTLNIKIRDGIEEINTSAGYIFVMILPMLMYLFRRDYLWVFGITLVLTMLTGKRGALVIYGVLALYMLFKYGTLKRESSLNWKTLLFIGCLIFGAFFFYENALESFQYRVFGTLNEYDEGHIGSGRNIIWGTLLNYWLNVHLFYQLFGSGLYSTINVMGFIAHNDFIQYLLDFGIIGFFLWVFIQFRFYINIQKIKYDNRYLYILLVFCLLILIGRGLFAGTLRTDQIYLSISIGFLLGIYQKERDEQG